MKTHKTQAQPYLIESQDTNGISLHPLPLKHHIYSEAWLQELLYKHPSILPMDQIDQDFTPSFSIGREIANIDNLLISPSGLITIVETKLWRNPEAHRTVVAQILEYANTLTTWKYVQLDQAVQAFIERRHGKAQSIYNLVKTQDRKFDLDEVEFQQNVQDCLENGKFALLIVGDRIFPGATQLAETIQAAPHMQYTMGFVELQCYKLKEDLDWPLVIFPHLVIRTNEVTRAIVKVVYEEKKPEIEIVTPEEESSSTGHTTFKEFVTSLPSSIADEFEPVIQQWINSGYTVYWGKVGFSLRLTWKGKIRTIFEAYPKYVGITQEKRARESELPAEIYRVYKEELMNVPVFASTFASGRGHVKYVNYENIKIDDLRLLLNATDKFACTISNATT